MLSRKSKQGAEIVVENDPTVSEGIHYLVAKSYAVLL